MRHRWRFVCLVTLAWLGAYRTGRCDEMQVNRGQVWEGALTSAGK